MDLDERTKTPDPSVYGTLGTPDAKNLTGNRSGCSQLDPTTTAISGSWAAMAPIRLVGIALSTISGNITLPPTYGLRWEEAARISVQAQNGFTGSVSISIANRSSVLTHYF
jgi:hypothetical protein